jgi:hypothetical protein
MWPQSQPHNMGSRVLCLQMIATRCGRSRCSGLEGFQGNPDREGICSSTISPGLVALWRDSRGAHLRHMVAFSNSFFQHPFHTLKERQ